MIVKLHRRLVDSSNILTAGCARPAGQPPAGALQQPGGPAGPPGGAEARGAEQPQQHLHLQRQAVARRGRGRQQRDVTLLSGACFVRTIIIDIFKNICSLEKLMTEKYVTKIISVNVCHLS